MSQERLLAYSIEEGADILRMSVDDLAMLLQDKEISGLWVKNTHLSRVYLSSLLSSPVAVTAKKVEREFQLESVTREPELSKKVEQHIGEGLSPPTQPLHKKLEKIKEKNSAVFDLQVCEEHTPHDFLLPTAIKNKLQTINDVLALYLKIKKYKCDWVKGSIQTKESKFNVLSDLFGGVLLSEITPNFRLEIIDTLKKMKSKSYSPYRNMAPSEIVTYEETDLKKYWSVKQINLTLELLSSAFKYFTRSKSGHPCFKYNPLESMVVSGNGKCQELDYNKRERYQGSHINAIFKHNYFTELNYKQNNHSNYWAPLFMYRSGLRVGEVAFLTVEDIVLTEQGYFFSVIDEFSDDELNKNIVNKLTEELGINKRVKTKYAKRLVPISQDLLDLGLLDYVAFIRDVRNELVLFPDLYRSKDGKLPNPPSKLSKRLSTLNVHAAKLSNERGEPVVFEPNKHCSHSFRHHTVFALENEGQFSDNSVSKFVGHKAVTYTGNHYGDAPDREKLIKMQNVIPRHKVLDSVCGWSPGRKLKQTLGEYRQLKDSSMALVA